MTKIGRSLLALFIVLLVLAGAVAGVAALLLHPEQYRGRIEALAQERLGRPLILAGDISVSIFPRLGLDLGQASLGNPPGFGDRPFASVRRVSVHVALWPLLTGRRIEVDRVVLEGLELNLVRRADGRDNWSDLLARGRAEATSPAAGEGSRGPVGNAGASPLSGLVLAGLELENGRIAWDDEVAGRHLVLQHLELTVGALRPGEPLDLDMRAGLVPGKGRDAVPVRFGGTVHGLAGPERTVRPLRLALGDLELAGEMRLSERAAGPWVETRLEGGPAAIGPLLLALRPLVPEPPALPLLERPVHWVLRARGNAAQLELPELSLEAGVLKLRAQLRGHGLDTPGWSLTGRIDTEPFPPRELGGDLGVDLPATADPAVLASARVGAALVLDAKRLLLRDLGVVLDDSSLTGSFGLRDFANPAYTFELHLDRMDLDRYLPPAAPDTAAAPGAAEPAPAALLPVAVLAPLRLHGTFAAGSLKVGGARLQDLALQVDSQARRLKLAPVRAKLYEGALKASIDINLRQEEPVLGTYVELKGVRAGPLLVDVADLDVIAGRLDFEASLFTRGNTMDAWIGGLGGKGRFRFTDGAVKGFDIAAMIRDAQARLGVASPATDGRPQTDFSELKGTYRIRKGVVLNQDLEAKSPLLRVTGSGRVDLVRRRVDYLLKPVLVATLEGQGGAGLDRLKGVPIPLRIEGALDDPRFTLDLAAAITESQKARLEAKKAEVKEKVEKKKEEARRKLEEKVQERLKGLFGR